MWGRVCSGLDLHTLGYIAINIADMVILVCIVDNCGYVLFVREIDAMVVNKQ